MKKISIVVIFILSISLGCQKDATVVSQDAAYRDLSIDSNLVSLDEAISISELQMFPKHSNSSRSSNVKKRLKSSFSVSPDKSAASFYIFNYENGGFSIVSGDRRILPVLAFSDTNSFPTDLSEYPSGLVAWMEGYNRKIKEVREQKTEPTPIVKASWESFERTGAFPNGRINGDPKPIQEPRCLGNGYVFLDRSDIKGPLTQTIWAQDEGYNDQLNDMGCSFYTNGKPPTGCVATATAQIMRYFQHPSTYNWSAMNDQAPSTETARLMKDIGQAVGMNYGCNGSDTETSNAASALTGTFGYTSASYQNYNYSTVVSNIANNKPVILKGGRVDKWWIFNTYAEGHAWVCDGTMASYFSMCSTYTGLGGPYFYVSSPSYVSTLHLHMNWGWSGQFNGWFGFQNFNPNDYTFNYKVNQIVNISKP